MRQETTTVLDLNAASFMERGVHVPFTTPSLAGARVRAAEGGIEFILANPAGTRGSYVVPWEGVRQFSQPTLHDTLLQERLAALAAQPGGMRLTPALIRDAAQAVALEGLAGRAARRAAAEARAADTAAQAAARAWLLRSLAQRLPPALAPAPASPSAEDAEVVVPGALARHLERPVPEVAAWLGEAARLLAPIRPGDKGPGRLPRLVRRLAAVAEAASAAAQADAPSPSPVPPPVYALALLGRCAAVAAECAMRCLARAETMAADPLALMTCWAAAPAETAAELGRADWVLDGWEPAILIWEEGAAEIPGTVPPGLAAGGARGTTAAAILVWLPPLPAEAASWTGVAVDAEQTLRALARLPPFRSPLAYPDAVARNERLRAQVA